MRTFASDILDISFPSDLNASPTSAKHQTVPLGPRAAERSWPSAVSKCGGRKYTWRADPRAKRMVKLYLAADSDGLAVTRAEKRFMGSNPVTMPAARSKGGREQHGLFTALTALHKAIDLIERRFEAQFEEDPITVRQAQVLVALSRLEGKSQADLVAATGIHQAHMSLICQQLTKRRLIKRRRTRSHGWAYAVTLTPAGNEALARVEAIAPRVFLEVTQRIAGLEHLAIAGSRASTT